MRNILLTLKYLGTAYHGWQVQDNAHTVQSEMQDAVEKILGSRESITGCSRTDAGVHANMYCCTLRTESPIDCYRLQGALNAKLTPDIAVSNCKDVPLDFHPRYNCVAKQYVYLINNAVSRNPFYEGRAFHYRPHIDVELLNKAAKDYIGTHDFESFCSTKTDIEDTVRTVYNASVTEKDGIVKFTVTADGFLYNMVRIMVGTLLQISEGKIRKDGIPEILESKNRKAAGITAVPYGLYLNKVYYDNSFEDEREGRDELCQKMKA